MLIEVTNIDHLGLVAGIIDDIGFDYNIILSLISFGIAIYTMIDTINDSFYFCK